MDLVMFGFGFLIGFVIGIFYMYNSNNNGNLA